LAAQRQKKKVYQGVEEGPKKLGGGYGGWKKRGRGKGPNDDRVLLMGGDRGIGERKR